MAEIQKSRSDSVGVDPARALMERLERQRPQIRNGTRVWFIDDPKLWYESPEQVKAYLSIDSSSSYKKGMHDAEHEAIQLNMPRIIAKMLPNVSFFDLGCGNALMTIEIVMKAQREGRRIGFFPVDISSQILDVAVRNAKHAGITNVHGVLNDFEKKIDAIMDTPGSGGQRFLNLGANFVNFDSDKILSTMSGAMRDKDLVYFSAQVSTEQNVANIVKEYSSQSVKVMVEGELGHLGFRPSDLEFNDRFNLKTRRVECYCKVKKIPEGIETEKIRVDDEIVSITSFKPTLRQFKTIAKRHFDGEFLMNSSQSYIGFIGTLKRD